MKTSWRGPLSAVALLVCGAGIAARLDSWFVQWPGNRASSLNPLDVYVGQGQRIFGTHFYRKADVYFHSGFYPTIFDNNESFQTEHMAEDAQLAASHNTGDEENFLGGPRDIIEKFSRNFFPSKHTHLNEGGAEAVATTHAHQGGHAHSHSTQEDNPDANVREIFPWLQLAATLDPELPETYTVTAYWLRERMGKDKEAEEFLRRGLKHLPDHPQLLFELGRVFSESRNDPARARYLWLHASRVSTGRNENATPQDKFILQQIESRLAKLAEQNGDYPTAIRHWTQVAALTPGPEAVLAHIQALRQRQAQSTNGVPLYLQP